MSLVDSLIQEGWLKTPRIIDAFRIIKRVDFMPEEIKGLAELNEAMSIGYGQTISQPLVVAFMLELLQPEFGDKILDIGSGSGWTTALLAQLVGDGGKIIAIERIPELKKFGEKNATRYNFIKKGIVQFICTDGTDGFAKAAPFDKILASASGRSISRAWRDQIKIGGRIVAPIDSSIWLLIKKNASEFDETEYPGFAFVPLLKGDI